MNAIREMRERANMTQEQLACNLGVERSTVAKWETGQSQPRVGVLKRISALFNVSIDRLVSDDDLIEDPVED